MLAAESAFEAIAETKEGPVELKSYPDKFKKSWVYEELHKSRNFQPSFKYGMVPGTVLAGIDTYLFRGHAPWTLHHKHADYEALKVNKTKKRRI
jgi:electron-transferring-flavoprotein dehydrogenase